MTIVLTSFSIFTGQLYGLEKFWAFMKYYKNASQLEVSDKLQGYLNQFKTIEDFRVEEPELNEMLQSKQQASKRRPRSLSENETTAQNAAADGSAIVAAAAVPTASSVRD
jgi:hypothetical protein